MELVALWDSDSACRWDLCFRLGAGIAVGCALGGALCVGTVDDSLGLVVAEFDEESCGVDAVAGLEVGELALHGGDEELDDEPAVLGFLGDDVGEGLDIYSILGRTAGGVNGGLSLRQRFVLWSFPLTRPCTKMRVLGDRHGYHRTPKP